MTEKDANKRTLVLALLGMLLIRLLAWGATSMETVHASRLNQTIPTPTPSQPPITPPTIEPTVPPLTPRPTRPPSEPSDTPVPPDPASPTPTDQPASGSPTPSATAASPQPTSPPGDTGTPLPTSSAQPTRPPDIEGPTSVPGEPSPSPTLTTTPGPSVVDTLLPALQTPPPGTERPQDQARTPMPTESPTGSAGVTFCSLPCLWILAGLTLIVAGVVILVRRRRAE